MSDEGICTNHLDINLENINGSKQDLTCAQIDGGCKISFTIRNFDLTQIGVVNIKLSEDLSLCSAIYLKIETSSSIPDEVSSISHVIWSDKDQFFRGSSPSIFRYLMTPSLFKTDSNKWEGEKKGYHITSQEEPYKGSQANVSEYCSFRLQYKKNLEVYVTLNKNWAVLLTQRLQVQPLSSLLSSLSGSIIGIMGIFGFFMGFFENYHLKYRKKLKNEVKIRKLIKNREEIILKNIGSNMLPLDCTNFLSNTERTSRFGFRENTKVNPHSSSLSLFEKKISNYI